MHGPYSTPEYLLPKMGGTPVSEPAVYRSLYILETLSEYLDHEFKEEKRQSLIRSQITSGLTAGFLERVSTEFSAFFREREMATLDKFELVFFEDRRSRYNDFREKVLQEHSTTGLEEGNALITFKDLLKIGDLDIPEWIIEPTDDEQEKLELHKSAMRGLTSVRDRFQTLSNEASEEHSAIRIKLKETDTYLNAKKNQSEPEENTTSELIGNTGPLDPFSTDDNDELQSECSIGLLTVHHQDWQQSGLALGNLLHSVCLAPGEVTQVAVVDWQRKSSGKNTEDTTQSESVASDIGQTRAVNEVQRAVAQEAQEGSSSASASSNSVQSGVSIGTLSISASIAAAHTSTDALTAQFSAGSRDLAAESSNELSQKTAEKSQSLRSRRAAVIREVTQEESETTTSRVLANYNRRHSLNVEYFEVLQLYSVKTELQGWERCLFVPLKPIDFSKIESVKKHQTSLYGIFSPTDCAALEEQIALEESWSKDSDEKAKKERRKNWRHEYTQKIASAQLALLDKLKGLQGLITSVDSQQNNAEQRGDIVLGHAIQAHLNGLKVAKARMEQSLDDLSKSSVFENQSVLDVLQANQLALSQQIWLRMDAYRVYRMLKGKSINGQKISTLIDPKPMGVFGNCVAFRWGFKRSGTGRLERAQFEQNYLTGDPNTTESVGATDLALPTSGVFAEAVLGQGEAAETIDNSKFWRWDEAPIPILPPKIADVQSRDRAKDVDLSSSNFATALAALRAQNPADVSHLGAILGQLGKGDMFRNMGGLAEAVSLSDKVSALSASGATAAGQQAADVQSKILDTFVAVLDSEVGKAVVGEFLLPGAGPLLMKGGDNASSTATDPAGVLSNADKVTIDPNDKKNS